MERKHIRTGYFGMIKRVLKENEIRLNGKLTMVTESKTYLFGIRVASDYESTSRPLGVADVVKAQFGGAPNW